MLNDFFLIENFAFFWDNFGGKKNTKSSVAFQR